MKSFSHVGRRNGLPAIDTSKYGIRIRPQPAFEFPKGHECYGCVFVSGKLIPPCKDRATCSYAFYQKLFVRRGDSS